MKKFLLSIFAVMLAVFSVQAQSYVKVTSAPTDWSGDYLIVYETGNVAFNGGLTTLDATSNTISVTINNNEIEADATTNAAKFTIAKSGNSYTIKSASGYYVGQSSNANGLKSSQTTTYNNTLSINADGSVNFVSGGAYLRYNATSGQYRFRYYKSSSYTGQKAIALYKYTEAAGGEEETEQTVAPVISPNGGEITVDTEITISCATEGAKIYYTIDGSTPTTASTPYTGAFKLAEDATVKAIAVADGLEVSAVATADFTFPVVCENIAAFIAEADEENNLTIAGEVVVVAQSGKYLFVQDNSAKIIVYGELGKEYKAGDRLTGIKGKYTNYNGLHEMYPDTESFGEAIAGDAIEPVAITLDELATTDLLTYVTVSNVTVPAETNDDARKSYTITDATGEVTMYNTLSINVPAGVATITGFVGTYKTTRQLMPLEIVIVSAAPAAPTLTAECEFEEKMTVEITNVAEGATAYYSLNNDTDWEEGTSVEITETTTVYAKVVKDGVSSEVVSAKYTKNEPVTPPAEGEATEVVDVLNREFTGIKSGATNYASWSDKTATSAAVYAGNSAGSNDAIQLRSNNSNSGIVTTTSGGKVKKIVVDWNSNTAAGRILEIYGKNTPYTNPTELYATTGNTKQGEKLGAIECGVSSELVIEGDYEYIGLRSYTGAMYLNSVEITWVVEEEEPVVETWSSFYAAFPVAIPEGVEAYIVTAANAGYVTLTQIYNAVPANTGVILKGGSIEVNYYSGEVTEVTGNLLQGTMADTYISEEAYVLGYVDGEYGFYKAAMNQQDDTAWLANAGKAYLPVSALPASAQGAANFSFRFGEGTTAIENVEVENEVKTIYDLTGRRIEAITAPGIYIVGGKKVLVK